MNKTYITITARVLVLNDDILYTSAPEEEVASLVEQSLDTLGDTLDLEIVFE